MFRIPYSLLPVKSLKGLSRPFLGTAQIISKFFPFQKANLVRANFKTDEREYISMCIVASLVFFLFMSVFLGVILYSAKAENFLALTLITSFVFTFFIFIQQNWYPRIVANRKVREVDRNLIAALQSMLVQFNSGVPLFDVLVNISKGNYGEVSKEFEKVIKEINAGKPQIEALEEIATRNPSVFFRRAIWQIVNGMKSGADISNVMSQVIQSLSEEQIIQIQNYGSQLNPLAMFYMLIAVIIPSLSITFIIVLSSFIALSESATRMIFFGVYGFILFLQLMFLGIIKSRRPNLASD